jgi:hypothetical protein
MISYYILGYRLGLNDPDYLSIYYDCSRDREGGIIPPYTMFEWICRTIAIPYPEREEL